MVERYEVSDNGWAQIEDPICQRSCHPKKRIER